MRSPSPMPPHLPSDAALFLDFDGTLLPIASTPDGIAVPPALLPLLQQLQDLFHGAVAIISGWEFAVLDQYMSSATIDAIKWLSQLCKK